jgi:hypothetical protein
MIKHFITGIMSVVVCSAVSVPVSAESLSYRGVGHGVSQDRFERNPSLYHVFTERFGVQPETSYYKDTVRDSSGKESTSEKSPDVLSKDDHNLAPSPNISPSVHGHRELGLSGDPSVKDLSGMDRGGFAPPGSYTGSERRF